MRILIVGAAGQLGQDLLGALARHTLLAPTHALLDVTDFAQVRSFVEATRPDVILNTSAFHDVPRCEREPETALRANGHGPQHLARAAAQSGARFVHISTDYVFDGKKGAPYEEDDAPAPLNVYGATKLAGEHLALAEHADTIIVRTTGLFGLAPCRAKPGGRNFVDTMLHLVATGKPVRVVTDQRCCPTYTRDLAEQIAFMLERGAAPGVYHAVNGPGCSWYELACLTFAGAGLDFRPEPVSAACFPTPVVRPADSRLATTALARAGLLIMRPLAEALDDYVAQRMGKRASLRLVVGGARLAAAQARVRPAVP